jgi:hypothetical protein
MHCAMARRIVDIEDPLTWPEALCELLARSKDVLSGCARKEGEIDAVPGARFTTLNEFAGGKRDVVRRGEEILATSRILGFHCTRLLPYEVESVRNEGLKLPSPEFLRERIERAVREGYLRRSLANALSDKNQAEDSNRRGKIGFVHGSWSLKQSGARPLLGSWGGEALYGSHEGDPMTGPVLRKLGEPYVVVAALPAKELRGCSLAKHFINEFLISDGATTRSGAGGFESWVEVAVPREWLVDVISSTDARFPLLTCPPE